MEIFSTSNFVSLNEEGSRWVCFYIDVILNDMPYNLFHSIKYVKFLFMQTPVLSEISVSCGLILYTNFRVNTVIEI